MELSKPGLPALTQQAKLGLIFAAPHFDIISFGGDMPPTVTLREVLYTPV